MLDPGDYYMNLAVAVSARANCTGRKVGAVLIAEDRVVSTGYNGTPAGFPNCVDGGCWRCREASTDPEIRGQKYDLCICVHAEQNALLAAAREGIHTRGTMVYTTLQPCFSCLKEALQAGVQQITYLEPLGAYPEDHLQAQYVELANHMPGNVVQIESRLPEWPKAAKGEPGRSSR